jgi:hypothetical protein
VTNDNTDPDQKLEKQDKTALRFVSPRSIRICCCNFVKLRVEFASTELVWAEARVTEVNSMDPDRCRADTDDIVPSFDVPDDALERAARAAGMAALTWNFCTYNYYQCGPIGGRD